jgi:urease gamma subunit
MPIRPFLEGDVFEQELIDAMSKALADACRELGLKDKEDAAVRLLAKRIIDSAREGIHDPTLLKAAAVKGLGPARKH